jgi:cell division protein FtsI (penicillin-binding protein 3)
MSLFSSLFTLPNAIRPSRSRTRIRLLIAVFAVLYAAIAGRMVMIGFNAQKTSGATLIPNEMLTLARPDIVDRNGNVLATDLRRPSLYIEPQNVIDNEEAAEMLSTVLPDLKTRDLIKKLETTKKGFFWVKRQLTPTQQQDIHRLGLPGVGFMYENKRVYPNGVLASHILGHVDIDNKGQGGIEKFIDTKSLTTNHKMLSLAGEKPKALQLSIDLAAQNIMREELENAMLRFKAKAAAGVVLDIHTGEVLSMVSLPDYDPNEPTGSMDDTRINRMTKGVFEMGSTFKAITTAMALDSGKIKLESKFDARFPLVYAGKPIKDFHGQKRVLTVPEVFIHSSNIGTAKMALALGKEHHKTFLSKVGQLDRLQTELAESAMPIFPRNWQEVNTVTASFGHGIAVAPLQAAAAVASFMNGGIFINPTFLKRSEEEALKTGRRVIREETSTQMRFLMRLNAELGSGKKAEVEGYYVGGKTGTSEKVVNGRYDKNKLLTSFMGVFPSDKPRYVILTMLDEPKGLPETKGYATSGWNAAPTTAKLIARLGPVLGLEPRQNIAVSRQAIPVNFKGSLR